MSTLDGSSYATGRRELMNLLAGLHATGIQDLLNLPQIAVVGSQSVGKSSLIESISGIKLPRESGTCTRCPMECRLEFTSSESWTCRISLRIQEGDSQRELPFGDVLTSPDHVEKRIRQAQRALLRPSVEPSVFLDNSDLEMQGGNIMSFTDNCVCIHIRGPEITDLHFYDLPGVIVNVAEGQDPSDIDVVISMVKRYISRSECIILLVVSCETDFENQAAGRLVREVDPRGERTVGVLTKPDKADAESAPKWQRVNEVYRLQTGWYVIKLPDSRELRDGISAEVAGQRAEAFFLTNENWRGYAQQNRAHVGTPNLTEHLSGRLSSQLRESLPQIREAVQRELASVLEQIETLPPKISTDPTVEVFAKITEFAQDISRHIRGNTPLRTDRRGVVQALYVQYAIFKQSIRATVPKFDARHPLAAPSTNFKLMDFNSDDETQEICYDSAFSIASVMKFALEARTRELPGNYPFSVKAYYINLFLGKWKDPTFSCFETTYKTFVEELDIIIKEHFESYSHGGLMSQVQMIVNALLQTCSLEAKAHLHLELCKETDMIYTQNEHYLATYKDKFWSHYKHILFHSSPRLESHAPARSTFSRPDNEFEPALDIMSEVRAYFQVSYKRYIDAVPLFLERALIRKFEMEIASALVNDLDLFKPGARAKCELWVSEPPSISNTRRELLALKKMLEDAQHLLLHFG